MYIFDPIVSVLSVGRNLIPCLWCPLLLHTSPTSWLLLHNPSGQPYGEQSRHPIITQFHFRLWNNVCYTMLCSRLMWSVNSPRIKWLTLTIPCFWCTLLLHTSPTSWLFLHDHTGQLYGELSHHPVRWCIKLLLYKQWLQQTFTSLVTLGSALASSRTLTVSVQP